MVCTGPSTEYIIAEMQKQIAALQQQIREMSVALAASHTENNAGNASVASNAGNAATNMTTNMTTNKTTSVTTNNNCNNNTTNNTNNIITNTTTNTTTNNHFHINMFRHEDTSYITSEQLKSLNSSDDIVKRLLEIVLLTHFNRDHPENMNAYVPHGAENGKVLSNKGWESMPLQTMAEFITNAAGQLMWSHVEDNEGLYKNRQAKRVEDMYDMLGTPVTREPIIEGTKATILENSHIVAAALEGRGVAS